MPHAIIAKRPGGTEMLSRIDITPPTPGEGEVLLRQTAIGVNFIDIYVRSGLYPWPVDSDLILGCEGAGVVEALGPGVSGFQPGDRVAYTVANGAYATHRTVPAKMLLPLPDGVSEVQAAGAMLKGLTTYYLLHDSYKVQTGDTVLFHAAAGGVGLLAGQWLAAKGARAIGTAGGPAKCQLAKAHGYAEMIDYRFEDVSDRVAALTDGQGVPVVYDGVGKDTLQGSLNCLRNFGTLVAFGQSSGPATEFQISDLAKGSFYLQRPILFHYAQDRTWLKTASAALFEGILKGTLRIKTTTRPLSEVAAAHEDLEARRTSGSDRADPLTARPRAQYPQNWPTGVTQKRDAKQQKGRQTAKGPASTAGPPRNLCELLSLPQPRPGRSSRQPDARGRPWTRAGR